MVATMGDGAGGCMTNHISRRLVIAGLLSVVTSVGLAAASAHYKPGQKPVCTLDASDGSADCTSGVVAGLGNFDVLVVVSVDGSADTVCHNPGNSLAVPGQNPAEGSGTGGVLLPASDIKNGSLVIPPISTGPVAIDTPTANEAGCPGDKWTVTLSNVTYSGFYSVQSPPGQQLNKLSFAFPS
jgi:hypothetical protein